MKKTILLLISILLLASFAIADYSDFSNDQKHHYYVCINDNKCSDSRNPDSCYSNCMQGAEDYDPSQVECTDTDGFDYFTKGIVVSSFYFMGKEDYCQYYNKGKINEKVYLFEYVCKNGKSVRYQKSCKEIGENYACQEGACIITNNIPVMNSISNKEVKENEQLIFTVTATDLDNDGLTYQAEGLPPEANFNTNNGQFSLSPGFDYLKHSNYEFNKVFKVKFRAFDGEFYSKWSTVKVTVKDVNQNPVLSSIGNKQVDAGEKLSFTLSSTDPDNENHNGFHLYWCHDYSNGDFGECKHFSEEDYPPGVNFEPYTWNFVWQTSSEQAGVYGVKFYAWDLFGGKDSENVIITVNSVNNDVYGCMDPEATNYNAQATINDDSCEYDVYGCTDETATNYNSEATIDDSSCIYEGTLTAHNLMVENKNRKYLIYQPASCKTKQCPLLIMFHGFGGKAEDVANNNVYGWQDGADENEFVVVFPDSLSNLPAKDLEVFGFVVANDYDLSGKKWDIANIGLPLQQRYWTQDVDFVEKIINKMVNDYNVDSSEVFSSGISYGGYFSYYVATSLPNKIKAFATTAAGLQKYEPGWGLSFIFPIPARDVADYQTPGIVLYSSTDPAQPLFSVNLINELDSNGQTSSLIVLPDEIGHAWDKTKNQKQWDFFMENN
jgi:predicted esterase